VIPSPFPIPYCLQPWSKLLADSPSYKHSANGLCASALDLRHDRFNVSATTVWQYQQERYPDAYSKYVAHTIPIVVVWGHSGDVRGGEQLDGSALAADHVQILCVKADSSSMMVVVNIWTAGLAILMATAWAGFGGL